jgi:hypothetical protein
MKESASGVVCPLPSRTFETAANVGTRLKLDIS